MMRIRESVYIWVTWLSRLLVGDASCEWATWYRSHHIGYEKAPGDFDMARSHPPSAAPRPGVGPTVPTSSTDKTVWLLYASNHISPAGPAGERRRPQDAMLAAGGVLTLFSGNVPAARELK